MLRVITHVYFPCVIAKVIFFKGITDTNKEIVLFTTDYVPYSGNYIATGHKAHMKILKEDEYSSMSKKFMNPENEILQSWETNTENNSLHISEALLQEPKSAIELNDKYSKHHQ